MKWIGLTGGIACGKSSVAKILRAAKIPVLDADAIAHSAFDVGSSSYLATVQRFGNDILNPQGAIDRAALGVIVFGDSESRKALEDIVHPFVRDAVATEKKRLGGEGHLVAVYDVPLLFEKQMENQFDQVIVVGCDSPQQILRLRERNGFSEVEALRRIQSQIPLEEKRFLGDHYIDNSGTLQELEKAVLDVLSALRLN